MPFYQYKQFMIDRYGEPLFSVPIDAGYSCPNRDADGEGGCSFCAADGGRAVQTANQVDIRDQIRAAMRFASERYGAKRWKAYIQAYTGTWASVAEQELLHHILLDEFSFDALSVGARPDCLGDDIIDLLAELNKKLEVWVEVGIQSANDISLERVGRGHSWAEAREAVVRLKERGLKVAPHVIIGLPGEGASDFARTADLIAGLSPDGVKIHNLHILKNTGLAREFEQAPFSVYNEYEYAEFLIEFIRRMPPGIPIMRISTDSPEENLIAPKWTMKKGQFLNYVIDQMRFREVRQGDLFEGEAGGLPPDVQRDDPIPTGDGSITFWSEDYKDHYHSPVGARTQAMEKYVLPSGVVEKLKTEDVRLLDICFGLGYNSICACDHALEKGVKGFLHVDALEIDRRIVGKSARHAGRCMGKEQDWSEVLSQLYEKGVYKEDKLSINMLWGDARYLVRRLQNGAKYDVVYLDGFSTHKNSEMWTVEFFSAVREVMKDDAVLLTGNTAVPVLAGLIEAGFFVGGIPATGLHSAVTIASLRKDRVEENLPVATLELIRNTSRGLSYRDPDGCWSNSEILQDRDRRRREREGEHDCHTSGNRE